MSQTNIRATKPLHFYIGYDPIQRIAQKEVVIKRHLAPLVPTDWAAKPSPFPRRWDKLRLAFNLVGIISFLLFAFYSTSVVAHASGVGDATTKALSFLAEFIASMVAPSFIMRR